MSRQRLDYALNLGLAAIAGLGGCIGAILIFVGLFFGIFLDNQLNTGALFTIVCIVISVPMSLMVMLAVIYRSAKTIEKRQYGTD